MYNYQGSFITKKEVYLIEVKMLSWRSLLMHSLLRPGLDHVFFPFISLTSFLIKPKFNLKARFFN